MSSMRPVAVALRFCVPLLALLLAGALTMVFVYAIVPESVAVSPIGATFWRRFMFYLAVLSVPFCVLFALKPVFFAPRGRSGTEEERGG